MTKIERDIYGQEIVTTDCDGCGALFSASVIKFGTVAKARAAVNNARINCDHKRG